MNARRARGVGGVDETRRCAKSLAGRPARLWADRVEQMRGQKAEREIALIFDAPFPAPGAPGASGPPGPQVSDLVEQKSAGLRLEYSASTAEWLTRVVEAPHDFALVYNFVSNLLFDSRQSICPQPIRTGQHGPQCRLHGGIVVIAVLVPGVGAEAHVVAIDKQR